MNKAELLIAPADTKSKSRLKQFENLRNPLSFASVLHFIQPRVHHSMFFSVDDVSILVNRMEDKKPEVLLPKQAKDFLDQHHLSVSTDGEQSKQRMITFNITISGAGQAPCKVAKFHDRNFTELTDEPKIFCMAPDLYYVLYHPSLNETVLNNWIFQKCVIPQLEALR